MGKSFVADIIVGKTDASGSMIDAIYGKVHETYAVYRTKERVVVQYADDDKLGSQQRLALTPLNPTKGEINGLIDGWRSGDANKQAKAKLFDRRVADALICALQGDQTDACALLNAIKADVLAERTAVARSQYVIAATIAAGVLVVVFAVFAGPFVNLDRQFKTLAAAAGFGALGALFSIALGIRNRSVLTDLQSRDNIVDAVLRIVIGATSAAILLCLLRGKLVSFGLGGTPITGTDPYVDIAVAFVAGFSERLVGDMLSKAVLSATSANPLAGGASARTAAASSAAANELNPLGTPPPPTAPAAPAAAPEADGPPPDDDDAEGCLAHAPVAPQDQTHDEDLPAAMGGVETKS